MQPNYPQQGFGAPQQPYGEPERPRANAGAAAVAGILGILAAGAMAWVVIDFVISAGMGDADSWNGQMWAIVIVRGVLALLLLVLAGLTFARKIGAAWTLFLVALVGAATILLEPLVFEVPIGDWFELLFQFSGGGAIAIVVASGLALLTAIFALFAGALKSGGQAQPEGF